MRNFNCTCGNLIFFENTQCLSCGRELGWCPVCSSITSLLPAGDGRFRCGRGACSALLVKCHNYHVEGVCNRCCAVPNDGSAPPALCDYCRFNDTIPDLTVPGHREMWGRLEAAKRRLLYTLDLLRLPYGSQEDGVFPPLSFDFKADMPEQSRMWWSSNEDDQVYTGHINGKIVINIREADTVELEKSRVAFQEAHRTVIGHFRHEIAHYYWQMLVQGHGQREAAFKAAFGDHDHPSYAEAQQRYYSAGPLGGWQSHFITAYATMHPWEDFAETFATYLAIVSVLDTALNTGIADSIDPTQAELPAMLDQYIRLGVLLNEMNRAMGLLDVVPEVFAPPIIEKMRFVHDLVRSAVI